MLCINTRLYWSHRSYRSDRCNWRDWRGRRCRCRRRGWPHWSDRPHRRHGCNWRGAYSRRCGSRRSDWFGYCYTDHELQYSACESACGWPACHLILIDFAIREAGSGISAAGLFSGLVSCMSGKVVSFCLAQSKRKSMRALFLPETGMAKTGKNCYT